jgi:transmembrane 9 superfamily protein 2/4
MAYLTALLVVCLAGPAASFYLPGVAPKTFRDGEAVNMKVQTLVSPETPLQFDYYQLPFCQPDKVRNCPRSIHGRKVQEAILF